jgi:hypothetical protein
MKKEEKEEKEEVEFAMAGFDLAYSKCRPMRWRWKMKPRLSSGSCSFWP